MFQVIVAICLLYVTWRLIHRKLLHNELDISKRTLFVTAHPDDELMFFGPSLFDEICARVEHYARSRAAVDKSKAPDDGIDHKVHLVCLSNGDFYHEGPRREIELREACAALQKHCTSYWLSSRRRIETDFLEVSIVNDADLPDSGDVRWSEAAIRRHIARYIQHHRIERVITFDEFGVSGHANHRSIFAALKDADMAGVERWKLVSVPLWRKYLSIFDIIPAYCSLVVMRRARRVHLLSLLDYLGLVFALKKHKSQMLWFRYLYFCASRYMFLNTLEKF